MAVLGGAYQHTVVTAVVGFLLAMFDDVNKCIVGYFKQRMVQQPW